MARTPRKRRITPLSADDEDAGEADTSPESEDTEELHEGEITQPEAEEQGATTMATIDLETASEDELVEFSKAVFEKLPIPKLLQLIGFADDIRHAKEDETRNLLLEQFRKQAQDAGFSFDTLFPMGGGRGRRRGDGQSTVAVKYRGPNGEAWSGRGMKAAWLRQIEERGEDIEKYRVDKTQGSLV